MREEQLHTNERTLILLALLTLIIARLSLRIQNENCYLLLALASIIVWIIPGFIMNAYLKKAQHG